MVAAAGTDAVVEYRPTPPADPSTATKESLAREVAQIEAQINRRFGHLQSELDQRMEALVTLTEEKMGRVNERLNGIDRATELRLGGIEGIPGQIDEKVGHLRELAEEKFDSVQTQFNERDTRSERESRDNKVAVDAAFAAQKEAAAKQDEGNQKAIDKSEAATAEKINKLEQLVTAKTDAIEGTIADIKERISDLDRNLRAAIGLVDAKASAQVVMRDTTRETKTDSRANLGAWIGLGGFAIGLFYFLAQIIPHG